MSQRARFGFTPAGVPQARIVLAGADIDTTFLSQIVYDADYMAARLIYSGNFAVSGFYGQTLGLLASWPDLGYIPFALCQGWIPAAGVRFYQSDDAHGPYGPAFQNTGLPPSELLCHDLGSINAFAFRIQRAGLYGRFTFSGVARMYYAIFAIPTGL